MTTWRVSVKPIEDHNEWEMCKSQGIIAIGWPSDNDDSIPQVRRFERIRVGDCVIAHVPASHGGGPGRICGVGLVTSSCRKVYRANLPANDKWDGPFRRQCGVNWLSTEEHDLRGTIKYWRGTVHRLKQADESEVFACMGYSIPDVP